MADETQHDATVRQAAMLADETGETSDTAFDDATAAATATAGGGEQQQQQSASSLAARRPAGHVHWGGAQPPSGGRIQVGENGPTVVVRGASNPSGVLRANHPGPLHLSSRLGGGGGGGGGGNKHDDHGEEMTVAPQPEKAPQPAQPTQLALTGAHGLDEEGLDNRAFLELQRELQRHESQGGDGAAAAVQPVRQRPRRYQGGETPDWAVSGPSTPGGTSDSGSYDAAADSDLDHIDFMAGEVDGMPAKPRRKKGVDEEEEGVSGWAKLRTLMGRVKSPGQDPEAAESSEKTRPHEEGGPTNLKSVPVTTSSGLRQGPRTKPSKYEREAAKLIRAHKLMRGQAADSDDEGPEVIAGLGRMPSKNRRHLDSGASTPDAMDTAANLDARPIHAGGVLGNILKLYEQQQREERDRTAVSSGVSSMGATTPESGGGERLNEMVADGLQDENRAAMAAGSAPVADPQRRPVVGGGTTSPSDRRKSWNPSLATGGALAGGTKFAGQAAAKSLRFAANEVGIEDMTDERPKASRSAGGVVGGLIATTGNLIGAVSPYHAQLGPNPKRPGYTLDRYLLPEMNAKTLKRTAEAVASAAPRPSRRSQSQPGTPGPRSPSSPGVVMGRPDGNASSETQAVTPSTEKFGGNGHANGYSAPTHTRKHSGNILNIPGHGFHALKTWKTGASAVNTPDVGSANGHGGDYFGSAEEDAALAKAEWQRKIKKRNKDKRKKVCSAERAQQDPIASYVC